MNEYLEYKKFEVETNLDVVKLHLKGLSERYNPNFDCTKDYPTVNHTDMLIISCIDRLIEVIENINERVNYMDYNGKAENFRSEINYEV